MADDRFSYSIPPRLFFLLVADYAQVTVRNVHVRIEIDFSTAVDRGEQAGETGNAIANTETGNRLVPRGLESSGPIWTARQEPF